MLKKLQAFSNALIVSPTSMSLFTREPQENFGRLNRITQSCKMSDNIGYHSPLRVKLQNKNIDYVMVNTLILRKRKRRGEILNEC